MKLCDFLDMIRNTDFLVSVGGLWDELPFEEYPKEKEMDYWNEWKDREVVNMALLTTNGEPELYIGVY